MVCHETYQDKAGNWLMPSEVEHTEGGGYRAIEGGGAVAVGRSKKMSKSRKNVVDPTAIIEAFGARYRPALHVVGQSTRAGSGMDGDRSRRRLALYPAPLAPG